MSTPYLFCDFMKKVNTRFYDVCQLYLKGLTIDDIRFLKPEDLINLVPPTQYHHKLMMTIMVRRYLYRPDRDLCSVDEDVEKDEL